MSIDKKDNPHKFHRSRLRARFMKEGLRSFEDHNILELLLFYAIPQKDTNDLAHALLDKFGSLAAVFDAEIGDLCKVNGIGENAATLIKLIPQLSRAYLMDKDTRYPDFTDLHKLGNYLVNYFIGEKNEKLIAVLLNNKSEMIDIILVSEGTVNRTEGSVRKIAEAAFSKNASSFVLAHNHPDGNCTPSAADVSFTSNYRKIFDELGLSLVEHIVVGGVSYVGIMTGQKSFDIEAYI
ncbi:MAG: RadC family protein [Clostridia bacterium]|nr:RadC family protein [Clostridia bacterium]